MKKHIRSLIFRILDAVAFVLARLNFISVYLQKRKIVYLNERLLSQLGTCGQGVGLYGKIMISSPGKMRVGDNVHINNNAFIRAEGGLIIGDNTHISRNLVLYTINHRYDSERLPYDDKLVEKPVIIGRNVWIGMNVCITPGTTIGDGAIVGMGSVVSGEVPPMSIVGNQKWRILGSRNEEHYKKLDTIRAYGGADGIPLL